VSGALIFPANDPHDVAQRTEALLSSEGYKIFRMPPPQSVPKEASDFGAQLSQNGVLFLPYGTTLFTFNDSGLIVLLACSTKESYGGSGDGEHDISITAISILKERKKSITVEFGLKRNVGAAIVGPITNAEGSPFSEEHARYFCAYFFTAVGLLSSGMAQIEHVPAPEKLNKKRAIKGKSPISAHNVVKIRPMPTNHEGEGDGRKGVRLHWRRGHVRKLADGKIAIVRPHLVGTRELGEIIHDAYDCRHMVQAMGGNVTIH